MSTTDQEPPDSKDDPIPEEVHTRAERLAKSVLSLQPKTQRELVGRSKTDGQAVK